MPKWRLDPGQIEVVDPAMAAILRTKTPAEKIAMVSAAHRTARALLTAQVQRNHPDWSANEVRAEVARRLLSGPISFEEEVPVPLIVALGPPAPEVETGNRHSVLSE